MPQPQTKTQQANSGHELLHVDLCVVGKRYKNSYANAASAIILVTSLPAKARYLLGVFKPSCIDATLQYADEYV